MKNNNSISNYYGKFIGAEKSLWRKKIEVFILLCKIALSIMLIRSVQTRIARIAVFIMYHQNHFLSLNQRVRLCVCSVGFSSENCLHRPENASGEEWMSGEKQKKRKKTFQL